MELSTYRKKTAKRNNLVWQAKCLSTEHRTSESFGKRAPLCESRAPRSTEEAMKGFQFRFISLLLLLSACAYAAEVTARIKGTVTDPSGAIIPNVTVTPTNQDTGVVTTTTTSSTGDYIFQKLPIRTYSLRGAASRFNTLPPTSP